MQKLATLMVTILFLTSCSTMGTLYNELPSAPSFTVEGKSYDQVYDAAFSVMSSKFAIESADKNTGIIKASNSMSAFSWGEIIGVSITPPKNASSYIVRVKSLKKAKTQITGEDHTKDVMANIKNKLGL